MSDSFKHLLDHDESSSPVSSSTQPCTKRFKKSFDPGSDNDNDQKLCPSNLNVEKGKERAISEPVTTNPQDPFDVFDAGIVHIIITELDAPDTETLRRVSKLWKASSEAHCGRTLLRQHFPEASLCENELGSIEEENLRFRRHCKLVLTPVCRERSCRVTRFGETNPFARSVSSSELPAWICHKSDQMHGGELVGFEES